MKRPSLVFFTVFTCFSCFMGQSVQVGHGKDDST